MRVLQGIPIAPGYGHGQAVPYRRTELLFAAARNAVADDSRTELRRVEAARRAARRELDALARSLKEHYGLDEGHIFHAQLLMLDDDLFSGLIRDQLAKGRSAEAAVVDAVREIESMFKRQVDPYLRERALDVHDVGARVLAHLIDKCSHPFARLPSAAVIVADELLPSDTVFLDRGRVRALVTAHGSENSHAAILARALGIPAVTGVREILDACTPGDAIAVDGETGRVILHIEGQAQADYLHHARRYGLALNEARRMTGQSIDTLDGVEITLLANVDRVEDIDVAVERHAAGIGLLRTEFLYMAEGDGDPEERQEAIYRHAARCFADRPITIRIIDLAPDKIVSLAGDVPHVGAALSECGIHYALAHPAILRPQLRAILRAAREANIRILLPGVVGLPEIDAFRALLEDVAAELQRETGSASPSVPVGAMIETPAALLMADAIAARADFLSLGTNDLLCHLFGRERRRGKETAYEPSFLRALELTVRAAEAAHKPLSICGEIAGTPAFTALLIGLGIRELSMSPERLPEVRYSISKISADAARALARRALGLHVAGEVQRLLSEHVDPWHALLGGGEATSV